MMNFKFGIYDLIQPLAVDFIKDIQNLLPRVKQLSIRFKNDSLTDKQLEDELKSQLIKYLEDTVFIEDDD